MQKETQNHINVTETEPGKFSAGFIMIGIPAGELPSIPLGPDKEHAGKLENGTDSNGKKFDIKAIYTVWKYDIYTVYHNHHAITCDQVEEEKAIYIHIYMHADSREIVVCRRLQEDGTMLMRLDATKKDQSKCFFEILFKKKG